jgi:hypothetical protein
VPITAGAGTTISTEEVTTLNGGTVSGQHVQRVMLAKRTANGTVTDVVAPAATVTNVVGTSTNVTMIAANTARVAFEIVNDPNAGARLYVKYGVTAASTSYTYYLDPGDSYREEVYTGRVDGVWVSPSSSTFGLITEMTP